MDDTPTLGRRTLLKAAVGATPMVLGASSSFAEVRSTYPPDVGRKFFADGRVHPFPGNTIICHLPQQGPQSQAFDALLDVYRDAPRYGFAHKIALLPPSSYHMTVFGGANDQPRMAKSWPADLPLDMPLDQCTAALRERIARAGIRCNLPIRMKVNPEQRPINGTALTMSLIPADEAEKAKLRNLRRSIATATRLPLPEPDDYRFHISIGYSIAWLTSAEYAEMVRVFAMWAAQVAARAPIIELGSPEFCTFNDMYAFHRISFVSSEPEAR